MARHNITDITEAQRHDLNVLQDAWDEMLDEDDAINDDGPMMVQEWTGQTWTDPATGNRWYEIDWSHHTPGAAMWCTVNPDTSGWNGYTETVLTVEEHPRLFCS